MSALALLLSIPTSVWSQSIGRYLSRFDWGFGLNFLNMTDDTYEVNLAMPTAQIGFNVPYHHLAENVARNDAHRAQHAHVRSPDWCNRAAPTCCWREPVGTWFPNPARTRCSLELAGTWFRDAARTRCSLEPARTWFRSTCGSPRAPRGAHSAADFHSRGADRTRANGSLASTSVRLAVAEWPTPRANTGHSPANVAETARNECRRRTHRTQMRC